MLHSAELIIKSIGSNLKARTRECGRVFEGKYDQTIYGSTGVDGTQQCGAFAINQRALRKTGK